MENLNLYESEQVAPPQQPAVVSMDALGNTNQDIFSNPFGDFNNQLISEVTMAKSTEITDMVMQQQPENEFCTLSDTLTSNLNNINNNKIINGSHEANEIFGAAIDGEQQSDPNILTSNDDNNNSNDNFNNPDLGPETDVDAIEDDDDDFQYHAGAVASGEKEKTQMEFKETDDVTDHVQMNFSTEMIDTAAAAAAENAMMVANTLENKIFEELSLHNPDMMMGGGINPFAGNEFIDNLAQNITDNKLMEEQIDEMQQEIQYGANEFVENVDREIDFVAHEQAAPAAASIADGIAFELEQELISANDEVNEEVAIQEEVQQQQQQPQLMSDLGIIGTATQGIEESEGSDDEWNYIKTEGQKETVTAVSTAEVEDTIPNEQQSIVESSPTTDIEQQQEQEEAKPEAENDNQGAPIEAADAAVFVDDNIDQREFTENLAESDNKFIEEFHQQQQEKEEEIEFATTEDQQSTPIVETEKDIEQEKEPSVEERHVLDEIEKDLQLEVETEEADDMDSQLNPDAKEFVPLSPVSPVRNEFQSPPPSEMILENGKSPILSNPILNNFSDTVVAQSPRKGEALIMEDVLIPEENDFDKEASERPHEVSLLDENFQRIDSPNELNLKEAMQVDDKLEQEYKDDSQGFFEEEKHQESNEYQELEQSFSQYSNGFQNKIDDAMNRSFYEGRDSDILADPAKNVLNTTQPLPDDEDHEAVKSESIDLLGGGEPVNSQMESSDNFEAEKFVEEIKGINENKYVDNGLSPTVPDFASNQTFEETIIATHTPLKEVQETLLETFVTQSSTASNIEILQEQQQPEIEMQHTEIKENIPEETFEQLVAPIQEAEPEQKQEEPALVPTTEPEKEVVVADDAKTEEPKSEIIAAAVASGAAVAAVAAVATSAVAKKKSPVSATSKPDAKKVTETKAKVAPKTTEVKKADVKPKTTASRPASATVSKTSVSKTSTTQVKPSVPSSASAASRPKTTASIPPVKKAPLSTASKPAAPKTTAESKPALTSRTTTTAAPKRPITSAPSSKPAPKPASASEVKSKVAIERKPLASSAPATRAPPAKPTTLASAKSKVNGTTSTVSTKSPTAARPTTTSRLSTSVTEKSANSPLKEKVLNKTAPLAATTRSPRPVTSSSTARPAPKTDLKSPSAASKSSTLSAVGVKKPLTTVKKSSPTEKVTTKTTTTVTKKAVPATKTSSSSTVKKSTTTTTTVVTKKVVNGDIVMEESNTTTKTTGDEIPALNGHFNGNGIAENGNGVHEEEEQQPQQPAAVVEASLI